VAIRGGARCWRARLPNSRDAALAQGSRPTRFHDLRHTTASSLLMSGANPAAVQRILRHSPPRITTEVYGHLPARLPPDEIDRLSFGVVPGQRRCTLSQSFANADSARPTPILPDSRSGNAVTGFGATNVIAQNGIQIGFGARGSIEGSSLINNNYSPCATPTVCGDFATSIIIFSETSGVKVLGNNLGKARSISILVVRAPMSRSRTD
jgi:Phage integrase family